MAKVSELKFKLNNQDYKIPVNVGVDGIFKAKLPREVATALSLRGEMNFETLTELNNNFYTAIQQYRNAVTEQELFIAIRYASRGVFTCYENDNCFFGYSSPYKMNTNHDDSSALSFDFKVVIKETVDSVENWYDGSLGQDLSVFDRKDINDDTWYKGNKFYSRENWKLIPFNQDHLSTLNIARENLRKLSEMLFKFIEQDSESIQKTLSTGKLLLN